MNRLYDPISKFFMVLLMAVALAACGSGNDGAGDDGGTGTLGVSLTDLPACGFDEVNVSVSQIRVHQSDDAAEDDGGWSEITLDPVRKINLVDLTNGVLEDLGETPLPTGHYTQLRVVLQDNDDANPLSNSVVLSSGTPAGEIALITPSAVESGIKLIHEFNVAEGERADLVLDFDACKSVVTLGNGDFLLKPVIKVIPFELNGIDGFVDTLLLDSNVMVTAQVDGTAVQATAPNSQGEFFLARLDAGTYDVVITADNHATVVIQGVAVESSTSVATVSVDATPISLPASATRTISGNVTLDPVSETEEPISVSAQQTFAGDSRVTVQFRTADLLSGDYTMTLPVDAPLLGQFADGTLPIMLAVQSELAGQYLVQASADDYQTQSVNADISAADATRDFTLVPAP